LPSLLTLTTSSASTLSTTTGRPMGFPLALAFFPLPLEQLLGKIYTLLDSRRLLLT
jgi:hypothetical protein